MTADHLSPDRQGKIGSSHVAALFGLSPYLTRLQLYAHFVAGHEIDRDPDDRMRWGTRLQDDILEAVVEERGWEIEPNPNRWLDYADTDLRLGCTLDAWVHRHDAGLGIVEVKNVDRDVYLQHWQEDSAPAHIELQLQEQLLVTGASWGVIAALVGGNELVIVPAKGLRLPMPETHEAILREVAAFWREVAEKRPPEPKGIAREAIAFAEMFPPRLPKATLDKRGDADAARAVADLDWATKRRKDVNDYYDRARIKVIAMMGEFELMRVDGAMVKMSKYALSDKEIKRRSSISTRLAIKSIPGEELPEEKL